MEKSQAEQFEQENKIFRKNLKEIDHPMDLLKAYVEAKTGSDRNVDKLPPQVIRGFEFLEEWINNEEWLNTEE